MIHTYVPFLESVEPSPYNSLMTLVVQISYIHFVDLETRPKRGKK